MLCGIGCPIQARSWLVWGHALNLSTGHSHRAYTESTMPRPAPISPGVRVLALGVLAIGLASLVVGQFDPGQPVPAAFPGRTALAFTAGVFLVVAAAALQFRRTAARAAAALTLYYALIVVLLMNGRLLLRDYALYVTYENIAMQLAIAAAALLAWAATAERDPARSARLTRIGRLTFGLCALVFGGAHFVYLHETATMVPAWLPPSPTFWAYLTGAGFVAAGLALLTGLQARLAAILLTIMLACLGVLANGRILLATPASYWNWTESAINLAVLGAAWTVADSLTQPRP